MSRYYLADGGHVLISGSTGARDDYGGKTVLANWWLTQLLRKNHRDEALFLNPKGHNAVKGNTVETRRGLKQSYESGNRHFDVRSQTPELFADAVRSGNEESVIAFDEAQSYSDNDFLQWVLAQGGNRDAGSVRALVVTQRPWNLNEELRANMPVKLWVGPMTPEGHRFFQSEGLESVGDQLDGEMDPYHWAVTDAGELQHINEPVPSEYA